MSDPLTAQLADEVGRAAGALGAIVGPDLLIALKAAVATRVPLWAAQLTGDDEHLAAATVDDLMGVLWPHGMPEDHEPGWWRTPLGQAVARSIGHQAAEAVSYGVAAAMLGAPRATVASWVRRGELDRHPDGGVLRSSLMARLAR